MSVDNRDRNRLVGVFLLPVLLIGVLIIVAFLILSYQDTSSHAQGARKNRQVSAETLDQFRTKYDKYGQSVGPGDAPVVIREFGDYQCPACGAFAPTAEKIRQQLVASGQARFMFFDFPLPMHANAFQAAMAARCAGRQDAFWPYHDRLYATQREWSEQNDPMSHFLDLAVESGVKTGPFKQCVNQSQTKSLINQEKLAGKAIGLRATPTIMVGDRMLSGAVGFERIKQLVDQQTDSG